jgi:hypothetical protein
VEWADEYKGDMALIFDAANVPDLLSDPLVQCIARCLGSAVSRALIECLWNNRKNLQGVRNCIQEKAVGALLSAAECVYACLTPGTP